MDQYPHANAQEIYQHAGKLIHEFGLDGYPLNPYR
jgi:hypothetical protein